MYLITWMAKYMKCLILITVALIFISSNEIEAHENDSLVLVSHEVKSLFPKGIQFNVAAESEFEVEEIIVRLWQGNIESSSYQYFDIEPNQYVSAQLIWYTNSANKYIPPGSDLRYQITIVDSNENVFYSDEYVFNYQDPKFQWKTVSDEFTTVFYHDQSFTNMDIKAENILNTVTETMDKMMPIFGDLENSDINVTVYNNVKDMHEGLPPESITIRNELITEGMAFNEFGTLIILSSGQNYLGVASHEMTHILVHRAGDGMINKIPSWLHEGLAEYANIYPSFSFNNALDMAIQSDSLLPITLLSRQPGTPEDKILFYGEASSIVAHMIDEYGADGMKKLLSTVKSGSNISEAILNTFNISKMDMENEWRKKIGASKYIPTDAKDILPTPKPMPVISLFSLTPQPGGVSITSNNTEPIKAIVTQVVETDIETQSEENILDHPTSGGCNQMASPKNIEDSSSGILAFGIILFITTRFTNKKSKS